MTVMPSLRMYGHSCVGVGAVVRRARRRRARAGTPGSRWRCRVAAAVPEVHRAHLARVHAGAGLVRELDQAGVVRRVVAEVVAVVPAVASRRWPGRRTRSRRVRAQSVARSSGPSARSGRGRPARCPCSRASRSCRRGRSAPRSRTSTGPSVALGAPASGPTQAEYGMSVSGSTRGATGCAGPWRRSRAWPGRRCPRCRLNRFGPVRGASRRAASYVRADADRRLLAVREVRHRRDPQHLAVVVVRVARRAARVLVGVVRAAAVRRATARRPGPSGTWRPGCCPSSRRSPATSSCRRSSRRGCPRSRSPCRRRRGSSCRSGRRTRRSRTSESRSSCFVSRSIVKREMRGCDIFDTRRSSGRPGRRARRVEAREVLQVDVAGLGEVGRDGDAEQAVLHLVVVLVGALAALAAVAVDGERAGRGHAAVERAVSPPRDPRRGRCRSRCRRSGRRGRTCARAAAGPSSSPRSASVRQSPRPM